jgi:16S rRNA (cytosine1402-N4)-methyltransferase
MTTVHVPILVGPIVEALLEPLRALPPDAPPHWIVDCTFGGGGHTGAFLEALAADPRLARHRVLGVDQDAGAIERGRARFSRELDEGRLELLHARFSEIRPALEGRPVLGMMADLGFSSDQIESAERGLSFQHEGPLDMRLDPSRGESALQFLQRASERELANVLQEYGEERFTNRIAAAILDARRRGELPRTTRALADLIVKSVPPPARHGRIHAATRTFQALRIQVNDELGELDALLGDVILSIRQGGRVAILSFHSLEDRRVKQTFREREGAFEALGKKPVEADEAETRRNPRARSAKLRIATRTR